MTKPTKIEDILKERPCGRGIECADWHGVCPEAVNKALSQAKEEEQKKHQKELAQQRHDNKILVNTILDTKTQELDEQNERANDHFASVLAGIADKIKKLTIYPTHKSGELIDKKEVLKTLK